MLERVQREGNPFRLLVGVLQPPWRTVSRCLRKLKIQLAYDPAMPLLGIHPGRILIQKEPYTSTLIAALLTIATTWKQPEC